MDRAGPAGQQHERDLERILGQVSVGKQMAADPQHHRPVTLDQGRERCLGHLSTAAELLEQGTIRRRAHGTDGEERLDLLPKGDRRNPVRHERACSLTLSMASPDPTSIEARSAAKGPGFSKLRERSRPERTAPPGRSFAASRSVTDLRWDSPLFRAPHGFCKATRSTKPSRSLKQRHAPAKKTRNPLYRLTPTSSIARSR